MESKFKPRWELAIGAIVGKQLNKENAHGIKTLPVKRKSQIRRSSGIEIINRVGINMKLPRIEKGGNNNYMQRQD